jgi:hypothetical protein
MIVYIIEVVKPRRYLECGHEWHGTTVPQLSLLAIDPTSGRRAGANAHDERTKPRRGRAVRASVVCRGGALPPDQSSWERPVGHAAGISGGVLH